MKIKRLGFLELSRRGNSKTREFFFSNVPPSKHTYFPQAANYTSSDPVWWLVGFPDGSVVKDLPANAGDAGSIPGSGRSPAEVNVNLLQSSHLKKSHGLAGYSQKGHLKGSQRVRHTHWMAGHTHTCRTPTHIANGRSPKEQLRFSQLLSKDQFPPQPRPNGKSMALSPHPELRADLEGLFIILTPCLLLTNIKTSCPLWMLRFEDNLSVATKKKTEQGNFWSFFQTMFYCNRIY